MLTIVTCPRCGRSREVVVDPDDPPPPICPNCEDTDVISSDSDVLEEEILYPPSADTLDEDDCEICGGPCQGH